MSMAELLPAVFEQLDYLDDGFVDGYVSHVGLRRIILETSDIAHQLGTNLSRWNEKRIFKTYTFRLK